MSKKARHVTLKLARAKLVRQQDVDVSMPEVEETRKAETKIDDSDSATDGAADADSATVDKTIVLQDLPQRVEVWVRLITLVCCSQKTVWVFRSRGLSQFGQTELLLVLERLPSDGGVPGDVIRLFSGVLARAIEGQLVHDLDHTVFQSSSSFLGSCYIGGVLYFMDSGQCFHGLVSPAEQCSLLICRLAHSREISLLARAPLRLLLRLGEQDGVYPCSLISRRFRPPVEHDSCQSVYFLFKNNATAATAASDTGLPDEAATTTTTSAADAVEESLTTTTPTMAAESGGAGGAAVVENPAPPDDRILGMPIPVFATVVSFFGTPIVFIMLCGFVAACKSLSCRRAVDQRSGKVAPSDSLASESFDTDGGKQGRLEMTEFSAVGKSWPGQRANEEVEAEPPPFKAIRTAEDDERIKRKQQQPQQQQQKLRNPYLEQLGQILK